MMETRLQDLEARVRSTETRLAGRQGSREADNRRLHPADPSGLLTDRLRYLLDHPDNAKFIDVEYLGEKGSLTVSIYNAAMHEVVVPEGDRIVDESGNDSINEETLWIDWGQAVPQGSARREVLTIAAMVESNLVEKLLTAPPGYRLWKIHTLEDDDWHGAFWQAEL